MSPGVKGVSGMIHRFPRVSGDEPEVIVNEGWKCVFSPRERG